MEGERVYGGSNMSVMIQNANKLPCSTSVPEYLWNPNNSPSHFQEGQMKLLPYDNCLNNHLCISFCSKGESYSCSTSMGTSEDINIERNTNMNIFPHIEKEENDFNDCDGYQPEKKRRLTSDQVHCLERSFEVDNKLEPERKVHLANELRLQPRQVAIWFQNRRAKFKTKQLEMDYGGLKANYDKLRGDYDRLLKEKERLKNEVQILTEKLIVKDKVSTNSESTESKDPSVGELRKHVPISDSEIKSTDPIMMCKQEDMSSAQSDILDSEQSDGDELFTRSLFTTQLFFPKLEGFDDPAEKAYDGDWNFSTDCQASWLWPS